VTVQVLVGGLVVVVPGADGRRCLRAKDCGGLVRDAYRGVGCYFIQVLLLTARSTLDKPYILIMLYNLRYYSWAD
jgi:hypothetical protein